MLIVLCFLLPCMCMHCIFFVHSLSVCLSLVSAHHFHPFYGFKINQKLRLELYFAVYCLFLHHSLSALLYVVLLLWFFFSFHLFTIFGSSFGCEPERRTRRKKNAYYLHRVEIKKNMCTPSNWKQATYTDTTVAHKTHVCKHNVEWNCFFLLRFCYKYKVKKNT